MTFIVVVSGSISDVIISSCVVAVDKKSWGAIQVGPVNKIHQLEENTHRVYDSAVFLIESALTIFSCV